MNDPETLGFYAAMLLFRNNSDMAGATLQFPPTLSAQQRRIVRSLASRLSLDHSSHGYGSERFVTVTRPSTTTPPQQEPSPELVYRILTCLTFSCKDIVPFQHHERAPNISVQDRQSVLRSHPLHVYVL